MAATLTNQAVCNYNLLGVPLVVNTNTIDFNLVTNVMTGTKSVSPTAGKSGDVVTFTITLLPTAAVTGAVVTDTLVGFTFVTGSCKVNGTPQPAMDPATGITVGAIGLNITSTVTFQATVN